MTFIYSAQMAKYVITMEAVDQGNYRMTGIQYIAAGKLINSFAESGTLRIMTADIDPPWDAF